MAWLHAKLQYMNAEWYKEDNNKSAYYYYYNIRELWGWILKYFVTSVFSLFFSSFLHVWDSVKTIVGNQKKFSLGKKESSTWMHSCCPQTHKQKQHEHMCEERAGEGGGAYERKQWVHKNKNTLFMTSYEIQQQQPSCRVKKMLCGLRILTTAMTKCCKSHIKQQIITWNPSDINVSTW